MTIFDDAVYFGEALELPANQNEEDLWNELTIRAREAGIEDPYRFLFLPTHDTSSAVSTSTEDSEFRSSISIRSQETHSTGLTSTSVPSRASRDQSYYSESPSAQKTPFNLVQASVSADNLNIMQTVSSVSPGFRQRHSTSSVTQSRFSSVAPQKPSVRRHRTSALFGMFRRGSSTCTSPSHHGNHGKAQGPKLDCGHSLSTYALRAHIQEARRSKGQVAPSCCGTLLPRSVLEIVLTKEEADIALNGSPQSPDIAPSRDSGYSEKGISTYDLPGLVDRISITGAPPTPPARQSTHEDPEPKCPGVNEAYKALKARQREQFQRIQAFESNQRKALSAHHQTALKNLTATHELTKRQKTEQHIYALEALEEQQILAEHDLRKTQTQEAQNVATALKHMQAYCTSSSTNPPTNNTLDFEPTRQTHTVTPSDHAKLARQHALQKNLPRKHTSAINVLRARQERYMQAKTQLQAADTAALDAVFAREKTALEERRRKDTARLEAVVEARRKRLRQRWDLEFEIWRRREDGRGSTAAAGVTVTVAMVGKVECEQERERERECRRDDWPRMCAQHDERAQAQVQTSSFASYLRATA